MALTQANLDAIDQAIARGELIVRHGEKQVQYRSMDELLAARTAIQRVLDAQAAPNRPTPRHMLADFRDDA